MWIRPPSQSVASTPNPSTRMMALKQFPIYRGRARVELSRRAHNDPEAPTPTKRAVMRMAIELSYALPRFP